MTPAACPKALAGSSPPPPRGRRRADAPPRRRPHLPRQARDRRGPDGRGRPPLPARPPPHRPGRPPGRRRARQRGRPRGARPARGARRPARGRHDEPGRHRRCPVGDGRPAHRLRRRARRLARARRWQDAAAGRADRPRGAAHPRDGRPAHDGARRRRGHGARRAAPVPAAGGRRASSSTRPRTRWSGWSPSPAASGPPRRHTWLKLPATADPARVAAATTCPILLLGGDAGREHEQVFGAWERALRVPNIRGLVPGRALLYPEVLTVGDAVARAGALVHPTAAPSPEEILP